MITPMSLQDLLRSFFEIAGNSLRSNDDIAQLPSEDRAILPYSAAINMTCMGAQFVYYHSLLLYYELFWRCLEEIYGKTIMLFNRWSSTFAESDMTICRLSLALFAFSSNARMFHRNRRTEYTILHIQNRYAEVIWKYLIYRYGYKESIRRYLGIIEWFLAVTVFI